MSSWKTVLLVLLNVSYANILNVLYYFVAKSGSFFPSRLLERLKKGIPRSWEDPLSGTQARPPEAITATTTGISSPNFRVTYRQVSQALPVYFLFLPRTSGAG